MPLLEPGIATTLSFVFFCFVSVMIKHEIKLVLFYKLYLHRPYFMELERDLLAATEGER